MMVTTGIPIQRPALDYSYRAQLTHEDALMDQAKGHLWDSMESGAVFHHYGSESKATHASRGSSQSPSPKLQVSAQCYKRRVSEPVQPMDLMGSSYGPYSGPYSSRASSTLPSPSPMTPDTEDMIDQWNGRRRPSDFATSAVTSTFSPKSPTDYDFPTGNHLPPSMNGSQEPTPRADFFPEGFDAHQAGPHFDQGSLSLDTKSSYIPMSGPPYPPQILDHNGDILPHSYLDPHVLNVGMPAEETYTAQEDLLNMDYGAELQVPLLQGIPQNALTPIQEDEYANTDDHADVYAGHDPPEEAQQALPLPTRIQPSGPSNNHAVHRSEVSQRSLNRHPSSQSRSNLQANNQCNTCNKPHDTPNKLRKHIRKEHIRPYPCIFADYGCNSVFGTKNEWSRHVKVQHLRLETWKCNIDECEKYTNDEDRLLLPSASKGKCEYDRKDLFLNHVRRCHKNQYPQPGTIEGTRAMAYEDQVQQQCHLDLRAPPMQTLCPCCPRTLWTDFDARLEHIGRAMEAKEDTQAGFHDPNLEFYMINEGLLQWREHVGWLLTGAEGKKGGRQARRGTHQRPLTTQAPLTAAAEEPETAVQPSRKSKRVELKKKKKQQLRRRQSQQQEETSDEDAEADDDDDYQGND